MFAAEFSDTVVHGTGTYEVVWSPSKGCAMYNTANGAVIEDTGWGGGPGFTFTGNGYTGTVGIPDRYTLHDGGVSFDGVYLFTGWTTCLSTCSADGSSPYFCQIGTLSVTYITSSESPGGHGADGNELRVNNTSPGVFRKRQMSALTTTTVLTSIPLGGAAWDGHGSWEDAAIFGDTYPFFFDTFAQPILTTFPAPWYDEILAVKPDGSLTVWRFAHTFNSGHNPNFQVQEAIQACSQDGNFCMWARSGWAHSGPTTGASACTITSDCRGDIFIVKTQ